MPDRPNTVDSDGAYSCGYRDALEEMRAFVNRMKPNPLNMVYKHYGKATDASDLSLTCLECGNSAADGFWVRRFYRSGHVWGGCKQCGSHEIKLT
jgi:hypothetical protein